MQVSNPYDDGCDSVSLGLYGFTAEPELMNGSIVLILGPTAIGGRCGPSVDVLTQDGLIGWLFENELIPLENS